MSWEKLTPKDRRTVVVACRRPDDGLKQLASELGTTHQVLKNRLRGIYAKIGVATRGGMMAKAWADGVVKCPCGANR